MKKRFTIVGVLISIIVQAQTKEHIDSLINETMSILEHYDCVVYSDKKVLNDDAIAYDTAYFYYSKEGLVYINWREQTHTFHITGDNIDVTELFFINNKMVFKRDYSYTFLNPQWHLQQDLNEVQVSIVESARIYYQEGGQVIAEYKNRGAEGKYKDRMILLNGIPLEMKLQRRWSNRCDDCIEDKYLSIYRELRNRKTN